MTIICLTKHSDVILYVYINQLCFVPSSLRTRGQLVLLMTTVSTLWLLFSKDLKVFHHRLGEKKTLFSPDYACPRRTWVVERESICLWWKNSTLVLDAHFFNSIWNQWCFSCLLFPCCSLYVFFILLWFNHSFICQQDSLPAQMAEVSLSASVWKWTHLLLNMVLTPLTGVRYCFPVSFLH